MPACAGRRKGEAEKEQSLKQDGYGTDHTNKLVLVNEYYFNEGYGFSTNSNGLSAWSGLPFFFLE